MIETYVLIGIVVLISGLSELEKHRASRREKDYLRMIVSLQNKLAAKDLAGFLALEQNDRIKPEAQQNTGQPQVTREDLFDAMNYGNINGS